MFKRTYPGIKQIRAKYIYGMTNERGDLAAIRKDT